MQCVVRPTKVEVLRVGRAVSPILLKMVCERRILLWAHFERQYRRLAMTSTR